MLKSARRTLVDLLAKAAPSLHSHLGLVLAGASKPPVGAMITTAPALRRSGMATSPRPGQGLFPKRAVHGTPAPGSGRRGWCSAARAVEGAAAPTAAALGATEQSLGPSAVSVGALTSSAAASSSSNSSTSNSPAVTFLAEIYIRDFALVAEQRLQVGGGPLGTCWGTVLAAHLALPSFQNVSGRLSFLPCVLFLQLEPGLNVITGAPGSPQQLHAGTGHGEQRNPCASSGCVPCCLLKAPHHPWPALRCAVQASLAAARACWSRPWVNCWAPQPLRRRYGPLLRPL